MISINIVIFPVNSIMKLRNLFKKIKKQLGQRITIKNDMKILEIFGEYRLEFVENVRSSRFDE